MTTDSSRNRRCSARLISGLDDGYGLSQPRFNRTLEGENPASEGEQSLLVRLCGPFLLHSTSNGGLHLAGEMVDSQGWAAEGDAMISMAFQPNQSKVIIEVDGRPFGVLVRLGKRYRFFASDSLASGLDRLSFRSPFEAEKAVAKLMQADAVEVAGEEGAR